MPIPARLSPDLRSNFSIEWRGLDRRLHDDRLLFIAYGLSDAVITLVGPLFWACLVWVFLAAELRPI
jgi:hypothetical protein